MKEWIVIVRVTGLPSILSLSVYLMVCLCVSVCVCLSVLCAKCWLRIHFALQNAIRYDYVERLIAIVHYYYCYYIIKSKWVVFASIENSSKFSPLILYISFQQSANSPYFRVPFRIWADLKWIVESNHYHWISPVNQFV